MAAVQRGVAGVAVVMVQEVADQLMGEDGEVRVAGHVRLEARGGAAQVGVGLGSVSLADALGTAGRVQWRVRAGHRRL